MKEKEFSEPEKVEIRLSGAGYDLANRLGYLCGYEELSKTLGKRLCDSHVRVILHVIKVEWE